MEPGQLRPGDVLVASTREGGCDLHGWSPGSAAEVVDVADLASARRRVLHLDLRNLARLAERERLPIDVELGAVFRGWSPGGAADSAPPPDDGPGADLYDLSDPATAAEDLLGRLRRLVADVEGSSPTAADGTRQLAGLLDDLARDHRVYVDAADDRTDERGRWPSSWHVRVVGGSRRVGWRDDTSALGSSAQGAPVALDDHLEAVRDRAEVFGRALRLPDAVLASVRAAAGWHDVGKADPRFQAMLTGGEVAAPGGALLAKSGMDAADRGAFRLARERSGYPPGMRHEAFSASAVATALAADECDQLDVDLVVHLVASHHGRSRPLLPPVADDRPVVYDAPVDGQRVRLDSTHTVDWDGPARFERLNRRYGAWGLARLEAVVRLADIACSEEGT